MGRNGCPRGRRLQWEVGALEGVFSSALDPSEAGGRSRVSPLAPHTLAPSPPPPPR